MQTRGVFGGGPVNWSHPNASVRCLVKIDTDDGKCCIELVNRHSRNF